MMKILVVQRGSLSTKKFTLSRSVACRVVEPLEYIRDYSNHDISFDILPISEISEEVLKQYKCIIFCKHNTSDSLELSKKSQSLGVKVVYDIDDLIYKFTEDSFAYDQMKNVGYLKEHLESADHVIISTETLKDVLLQDFKLKKYSVIRTGINTDKYKKESYDLNSKDVFFTNGDNLKLISFRNEFCNTFNTFLEENKELNFKVFGDSEEYLKPFTRYNFLGNLPWDEHKVHLVKNNYRFAIIPLGAEEEPTEHQMFSKCKTPIKYLEYGALKIPGIYSNSFIYEDVIKNEDTGILTSNDAESWLHSLNKMNDDENFRKKIIENAYDDVNENHHMKHKVNDFLEALN